MHNKIKLFCFPYAGGSSVIFNQWKQYLAPQVELVPVELAGRGSRIDESLINEIHEVIEDVLKIVKGQIKQYRYALFGHSLGCMIAYLLAQKIQTDNLPLPLHLFFSGRGAPHVESLRDKKYHLMDNEAFKHAVFELGGTPPEIFEHSELLDFFLPILRNDFKLAETEIQSEKMHPLNSDLTVLLGKGDDLTQDQCTGWTQHTRRSCNFQYFEGGHFFLHDETESIVRLINSTLMESNRRYRS